LIEWKNILLQKLFKGYMKVFNKFDTDQLKIQRIKTTPKNVEEANEGLFAAKLNLPEAAAHCGMTHKEMKMIFWEYLKYNPPTYVGEDNK